MYSEVARWLQEKRSPLLTPSSSGTRPRCPSRPCNFSGHYYHSFPPLPPHISGLASRSPRFLYLSLCASSSPHCPCTRPVACATTKTLRARDGATRAPHLSPSTAVQRTDPRWHRPASLLSDGSVIPQSPCLSVADLSRSRQGENAEFLYIYTRPSSHEESSLFRRPPANKL